MDIHKMQSHRYQIPHLEIKSEENFEEQIRRAAAFFWYSMNFGGTSVASKVKFRDSIFQ
jgi:predicted Ser/Thr protein kinase